MPSYARKRDKNQTELDDAARRLGWTVIDTSQCAAYVPGWPDAVWLNSDGVVLFVEYKGEHERLTDAEFAFYNALPRADLYVICRSVDDVLAITRRRWGGGRGGLVIRSPHHV